MNIKQLLFYVAYTDPFSPHYNDMTSWQSSSAEKVSCNLAPFFFNHRIRQATFF